jgi:hypothetical protein
MVKARVNAQLMAYSSFELTIFRRPLVTSFDLADKLPGNDYFAASLTADSTKLGLAQAEI